MKLHPHACSALTATAAALLVSVGSAAAQTSPSSPLSISGFAPNTPVQVTFFAQSDDGKVGDGPQLGPALSPDPKVDSFGILDFNVGYANSEMACISGMDSDGSTPKSICINVSDTVGPDVPGLSYDSRTKTLYLSVTGEYNFSGSTFACIDRFDQSGMPVITHDITDDTDLLSATNPVVNQVPLASVPNFTDGVVLDCNLTDPSGNQSAVTFIPPVRLSLLPATANNSTAMISGTASPDSEVRVMNGAAPITTLIAAADGTFTANIPNSSPTAPWQVSVQAINTRSEGFIGSADPLYSQIQNKQFVNIPAVSLPPAPVVGTSDSYETSHNAALTIASPGVLDNDSGPTGAVLSAAIAQNPTHGTVVLSADGGFTYTPQTGYAGTDSFTYIASYDSSKSARLGATKAAPFVNSDPITVNITVKAAAQPTGPTSATPVPTLGTMGLLLMSALLGGIAALRRRSDQKA